MSLLGKSEPDVKLFATLTSNWQRAGLRLRYLGGVTSAKGRTQLGLHGSLQKGEDAPGAEEAELASSGSLNRPTLDCTWTTWVSRLCLQGLEEPLLIREIQ